MTEIRNLTTESNKTLDLMVSVIQSSTYLVRQIQARGRECPDDKCPVCLLVRSVSALEAHRDELRPPGEATH